MPKSAAFAPSGSGSDADSGSGDLLSKLPRLAQQYLRTLADRPNTRRNYLYALSDFFCVVPKDPVKVKLHDWCDSYVPYLQDHLIPVDFKNGGQKLGYSTKLLRHALLHKFFTYVEFRQQQEGKNFKNPIPKFEWAGITSEESPSTAIPATVSVAPTEITEDAVLGKVNRCIPWDYLPRILQAARSISYCLYLVFKLFLFTGIRAGELSTIRRKNVHVDQRWVGTGVEPGNRKGNRKVRTEQDKRNKLQPYFLPEDLAEEVRQWNAQQESNYPANEWLFPGKGGVGHIKSRSFDLWARALSTKLDFNFTPHWFRHSLTTYRINKMGCSDDDAGRLINHKSGKVIAVYNDADLKTRRDLYDKYNPYPDWDGR